eukprot:2948588-Rhodomonas_salina.3
MSGPLLPWHLHLHSSKHCWGTVSIPPNATDLHSDEAEICEGVAPIFTPEQKHAVSAAPVVGCDCDSAPPFRFSFQSPISGRRALGHSVAICAATPVLGDTIANA